MNFKNHFERFRKLQAFLKENNKIVYMDFTNRILKYGPSGLPSESLIRYFASRPLGTAVADPELTRLIIFDGYDTDAAQYLLLKWDEGRWQAAGTTDIVSAVAWLAGAEEIRKAA